MISSLRRRVKKFEKYTQGIKILFNLGENKRNKVDISSDDDERKENEEIFDGFKDEEMEGSKENEGEEEEERDDKNNEGK